MKKFLCTVMFSCLIFLAGCGQNDMVTNSPSRLQDNESVSDTVTFVSGMGCSDSDCTDASHHHDCPPDCGDYEHHHNCGLDCTETSHHHNGTSAVDESEQHHEEQRQQHTKQHHGDSHH